MVYMYIYIYIQYAYHSTTIFAFTATDILLVSLSAKLF